MSWLAGEQRLCIEYPNRRRTVHVDPRGRTTTILYHSRRILSEAPRGMPFGGWCVPGGAWQRHANRGALLHKWRVDTATVPGLNSPPGPVTAYIASDGLVPRIGVEGAGGLEAMRVEYVPQDPTRFRPPADYRPEALPR